MMCDTMVRPYSYIRVIQKGFICFTDDCINQTQTFSPNQTFEIYHVIGSLFEG